jgi:hypothetical protein
MTKNMGAKWQYLENFHFSYFLKIMYFQTSVSLTLSNSPSSPFTLAFIHENKDLEEDLSKQNLIYYQLKQLS